MQLSKGVRPSRAFIMAVWIAFEVCDELASEDGEANHIDAAERPIHICQKANLFDTDEAHASSLEGLTGR